MKISVRSFFGGAILTALAVILIVFASYALDGLKKIKHVNFDSLEDEIVDIIDEHEEETKGTWSVYVEDPNSKDEDHLYINQKQMRGYGMMNLFIAGAAYEHYEELAAKTPNIEERIIISLMDDQVADILVSMMGNGDVAAGFQIVNDFCAEHDYADTKMNRRILVKDVTENNYTSAKDCAAFFRDVYKGRLDHSEELLEILEGAGNDSKIARAIPGRFRVANRTGDLTTVQNDCALVFSDKPYIICIMVQDLKDVRKTMKTMRKISEEVYRAVN